MKPHYLTQNLKKLYKYLCILFILFLLTGSLKGQDLPGPAANIQSLPLGSYVIPMDNTYQLNSSSIFNLKAYGLIVHLLNNSIKVKWVITAGKLKDGIDFTATTDQIKPVINAIPASRNFKAGPFVIFAGDTTGVSALIDAFYTTNSLAGNNRPNIYRITIPVNVDIRYNLTGFKPMAAILNDGGTQAIHTAFMVAASVPPANYEVISGKALGAGCYTFAAEPHNATVSPSVDSAIRGIRDFVLAGGNFLAQCVAVESYENNPLGRFQTTTGVTTLNVGIGTTLSYPNADLGFSQFEGVFNASLKGTTRNWRINASGINNNHHHATGTGVNSSVIGASVSKLAGYGGMVFYLGNHDFTTADIQNTNGIRMYMNAFLTPANFVCLALLPAETVTFSGRMQDDMAVLSWKVKNDLAAYFTLERSNDGISFSSISQFAHDKNDPSSYIYTDPNILTAAAYYRLKINSGETIRYSKVVILRNTKASNHSRILLNQNPVVGSALAFSYEADTNDECLFTMYNNIGSAIYSARKKTMKGMNTYSIPLNDAMAKGIYFVEINNKGNRTVARFIRP